MGRRPRAGDVAARVVPVRLTEAEVEDLDRIARDTGVGRSDAIRIALRVLDRVRLAARAVETASPDVISDRMYDAIDVYRDAVSRTA